MAENFQRSLDTLERIDFVCGEMYQPKCSLIVNFLRVKIICHELAENQ